MTLGKMTLFNVILPLLFCSLLSPAFAWELKGRVKIDPPFPEASWIPVPQEQAACGEKKRSPKLEISPEGYLKNAVVRLEGDFSQEIQKLGKLGDGSRRTVPNYEIDQIGCEFQPHILLIPQGETLRILNSDDVLHNVRAFFAKKIGESASPFGGNESFEMLFNDAMPKKGQVLKKKLSEPGRLVIRCGLHHWMHAFVVVQEHPFYAVTDENGQFEIRGVPDGRQVISAWHETLGVIRRDVDSEHGFLILAFPPST